MKTVLAFILSFFCVMSPLMAGPLDKAREAFSAGDYKKANSLAKKAVKKLKSKSEKAEAYALMGAATVKLGKKKPGRSRFIKAIKLDSNVSLPSEVSSDKAVKKVWASAQKKAGGGGSRVSDSGSSGGGDRMTKSSSGKSALTSPSNIKNYLPFGINSFMQGKTLPAVAFGGGQALGLILYLNRSQAAAEADKDAKTVIAEYEGTENPTPEETAGFNKFLDQNAAFVKQANSESTMTLLLFVAAYGLSVADALFDPLGMAKSAAVESSSDERYAELGSSWENRSTERPWKLDLQVLPSRSQTMLLGFSKEF